MLKTHKPSPPFYPHPPPIGPLGGGGGAVAAPQLTMKNNAIINKATKIWYLWVDHQYFKFIVCTSPLFS